MWLSKKYFRYHGVKFVFKPLQFTVTRFLVTGARIFNFGVDSPMCLWSEIEYFIKKGLAQSIIVFVSY